MVRGIHKQIIEIKCTNSEHFEKLLLIVRPDRNIPANRILAEEAAALIGQLPQIGRKKCLPKDGGVFSRLPLRERIFVYSLCALCIILLAAVCAMAIL